MVDYVYFMIGFQTDGSNVHEPLDIENTLWTNTVVASGSAVGLVVYTGVETRSAMNTSQPKMKVGLFTCDVTQCLTSVTCHVFLTGWSS